LTQIRDGIDDLDAQILQLLAQRAGFVREATRFKSTLSGKSLRMMRSSERDKWVLKLNRCRCSIAR
jgi:chorismate mutase